MTFVQGQRVIVVDASAAIRFLEADPDWVESWRGWTAAQEMVVAPPHFAFEVANGLLLGTSVGPVGTVIALVEKLFSTGLEVVDRGQHGIEGALRLADRHRLTVYDAAYLDLAIDVDGELATLDAALRGAAEAEGVTLA